MERSQSDTRSLVRVGHRRAGHEQGQRSKCEIPPSVTPRQIHGRTSEERNYTIQVAFARASSRGMNRHVEWYRVRFSRRRPRSPRGWIEGGCRGERVIAHGDSVRKSGQVA